MKDEHKSKAQLLQELAALRQRVASLEARSSQRQPAEKRLEELDFIINHSPVVVFLWRAAPNWPVEYVSANVQRIFGYDAQDFYTHRISYPNVVHPDDRERLMAQFEGKSQQPDCQAFRQEYRFITQSGQVRWANHYTWVRRTSSGTASHYQGIILDVTERKEAEKELVRRENNLSTLVSVQQHLLSPHWRAQDDADLLKQLGQIAGASRVYLFENERSPGGPSAMSQRAQWCTPNAPHVGPIDDQERQRALNDSLLTRWREVLEQGGVISGPLDALPQPENQMLASWNVRSILILPLHLNDELAGLIGFEDCLRERTWGILEISLLQSAAAAISLAKEKRQADAAIRKANTDLAARVDELAILNYITKTVATGLDLDEVLHTIAETMTHFFNAQGTVVSLADEAQSELTIVAHYVRGGGAENSLIGTTLPVLDGPFRSQLLHQSHPVILSQAQIGSLPESVQEIVHSRQVRSLLSLPLQARGVAIGLITVTSSQESWDFSPTQLRLAETIAGQVAGAIETARLFEKEQRQRQVAERRVAELAALNNVGQTVATVLDMEAALQATTETMVELFSADQSGVALLNPTKTALIVTAEHPQYGPEQSALGVEIPLAGNPASQQVVETGKSLIVPHPQTSPLMAPVHELMRERGVECIMIVPLLARGEVIGTIGIDSTHKERAFTPAEVKLAETVALQIAGAIENARLYEQAQQEIADRTLVESQLRAYTQELEASNAELDAFAHTVAHDLKNPLTLLTGFSSLLEKRHARMKPAKIQSNLRAISQAGRKMTNIIDELLLLSSVRKMDEIEIGPLDTAAIVAEAQSRLSPMIDETQADIQTPDPATWPVALGYAPWVEEVWVNYISNGLKYGGQPPYVELGATQQADGWVRFWVWDNGPGLTAEEQARLFAQFTRLHQVRAEGHGLGLSIVRRIVEKLGGQVGVESEGVSGQGCTFYFVLPADAKP